MDVDDHGQLDEFIDEVRASQRNIVFPHTVRNARSVDAFLWRGSPDPTLVQRIGAWLIGVVLVGSGIGSLWLGAQAHWNHDWIGFGLKISMSLVAVLIGLRVFRNGFPRHRETDSKLSES
jgi:hypothetical protein